MQCNLFPIRATEKCRAGKLVVIGHEGYFRCVVHGGLWKRQCLSRDLTSVRREECDIAGQRFHSKARNTQTLQHGLPGCVQKRRRSEDIAWTLDGHHYMILSCMTH